VAHFYNPSYLESVREREREKERERIVV
jgi:hypothetical protein